MPKVGHFECCHSDRHPSVDVSPPSNGHGDSNRRHFQETYLPTLWIQPATAFKLTYPIYLHYFEVVKSFLSFLF